MLRVPRFPFPRLAVARASAAIGGCVAMLSVLACTPTVDFMKLNRPPHKLTPRPAASVEIFARKSPTRPFVEVYMLEVDSGDPAAPGDALSDLREQAGKLGCDGLMLTGRTKTVVVGEPAGIGGGFNAVCIVYRDTPPPPS